MTIMRTALMEKVRKKELYIVGILGLLIVLLFSSGNSNITISGESITGYSSLVKILLIVVNAVSGALAIALSLGTIDKEYERKTSDLILVRGVSQTRYHTELALANIVASCLAGLIMYIGILVFSLTSGETSSVIRLIPSYLIVCISITFISLLTSALTIKLPGLLSGIIATVVFIVGICHGLLELISGIAGGLSSKIIDVLLTVTPDLNAIQQQASNILSNSKVEIFEILSVLLMIYIVSILFVVLKRSQ